MSFIRRIWLSWSCRSPMATDPFCLSIHTMIRSFRNSHRAARLLIRWSKRRGGPAFSTSLPPGITAALGEHRLIPIVGARFVPVTEAEAKEIVVKMARNWYQPNRPKDDKDYATAFRSAAMLPGRTECSAVETSKPRFIVGAPHEDPRKPILVAVPVGRGNVDLVKLADGRFVLVQMTICFPARPITGVRCPIRC
jgi:hypothetical protein